MFDNQICDISALSGLSRLNQVSLSNNQVRDQDGVLQLARTESVCFRDGDYGSNFGAGRVQPIVYPFADDEVGYGVHIQDEESGICIEYNIIMENDRLVRAEQ